jgi:plasmanylethanolamine desaturase
MNTASNYKTSQRLLECASIALFAALAAFSLWRLSQASGPYFFPVILIAALIAWMAVDLLSGFLHMALDSWGNVRTPIIGHAFIRPFREHHVNPSEMTRHDFIELNGASSFACLPLLLLTASMPLTSHAWLCLQAVLLFTALAALITNECHKWAHAEAADTPPLIRWAQRYRLVLSPEHHRLHHTAPFNSHFCMANGWLNAPLNACLRAWR